MKINLGLVEYVKKAHDEKWGYVWGTFGQVLTERLYQDKLRQYPKGVGNYKTFIRQNWLGKRTADCVGLIKSYVWFSEARNRVEYNSSTDTNANGMYRMATKKGPIHTIPEVPGLCVWRKGHIGVYVGNGWVIEARGTVYGVKRYRLKDRNFTHWLECPFINYKKEQKPSKPPVEQVPKERIETGLIQAAHRGQSIDVRGLKRFVGNEVNYTQFVAVRDLESFGYSVEWKNGVTVIEKADTFEKFNLNKDYIVDDIEKTKVRVSKGTKEVTLDGYIITDIYGNGTQFIALGDLKELGFKVSWDQANKKVVIE